jgi:hypothetical protein
MFQNLKLLVCWLKQTKNLPVLYATVVEGVTCATLMDAPIVIILLFGLIYQYINCSIAIDCRIKCVAICIRLI